MKQIKVTVFFDILCYTVGLVFMTNYLILLEIFFLYS